MWWSLIFNAGGNRKSVIGNTRAERERSDAGRMLGV